MISEEGGYIEPYLGIRYYSSEFCQFLGFELMGGGGEFRWGITVKQ